MKIHKLCILVIFFVRTKFAFAYCYEKSATKKVEVNGYDPRYGYSRNRLELQEINSTIICSNLTSLKIMDYYYNNQKSTDQFLEIKESVIQDIEPSSLTKFSTIKKLYLRNIKLEDIFPAAFNELNDLEELYLNCNNIQKILRGVFNSLGKLKILDLSENRISIIDQHSFLGVAQLQELHLQINNISTLPDNFLEKLENLSLLDVSGNVLNNILNLNFPKLKILRLGDNQIQDFDIDLSNLTMQELNLSNNQCNEIQLNFWPAADIIDFSKNRIVLVKNYEILENSVVNLMYNNINEICEFSSYSTVSLLLGFNNITTVNSSMFDLIETLQILGLEGNHISEIPKTSFINLLQLQHLNLSHNEIAEIPVGLFKNLLNLTILDLSSNQIKEFRYGTFDSLKSLVTLNISTNRLFDLHQDTFHSLNQLRTLNFDHNKISSIDFAKLLQHMDLLKSVSLDFNNWTCDELVKCYQYFKVRHVEISEGSQFDVDNFHGVACRNDHNVLSKNYSDPLQFQDFIKKFQQSLDRAVDKSKMNQFFTGSFQESKFFRYFDTNYKESNFFKYLNNYKFSSVVKSDLNQSKSPTSDFLHVEPVNSNDKILLSLSLFVQIGMVSLLAFIIFAGFRYVKKMEVYSRNITAQIDL